MLLTTEMKKKLQSYSRYVVPTPHEAEIQTLKQIVELVSRDLKSVLIYHAIQGKTGWDNEEELSNKALREIILNTSYGISQYSTDQSDEFTRKACIDLISYSMFLWNRTFPTQVEEAQVPETSVQYGDDILPPL